MALSLFLTSSLICPSSGLCDPPHRGFPKQLGSAPGGKRTLQRPTSQHSRAKECWGWASQPVQLFSWPHPPSGLPSKPPPLSLQAKAPSPAARRRPSAGQALLPISSMPPSPKASPLHLSKPNSIRSKPPLVFEYFCKHPPNTNKID